MIGRRREAERSDGTDFTNAIEADGLIKRFGKFTAVDGVDFVVRRGTIFGFLGPNGAGKTTTIRMLLGLMKPTEGVARVLGYDVARKAQTMRRRMGYMSQKFSLYRDLTVEENLMFYGRVYGLRGRRLAQRKRYALEMAGLKDQKTALTRDLAGGWKQRLALGSAILHEPELLFLDEPTAGVDPISRRAFWDLLYELAEEGTTIFVTTHYMDEAERCQDLAFILRGRIVAKGSPQEIKREKMRGRVLEVSCSDARAALPELQAMEELREVALYGARLHIVVNDGSDAYEDAIRRRLEGVDLTVESIDEVLPSLEDVFISQVRARIAADGSLADPDQRAATDVDVSSHVRRKGGPTERGSQDEVRGRVRLVTTEAAEEGPEAAPAISERTVTAEAERR